MMPFVFFTFVAFLLKMAFPGEMARQVSISIIDIVKAFLYPADNPMAEMWFVATLMWFFLLMPIWIYVIRRQWTKWFTLVILLILHFSHPNIGLLCFGSACKFAIWFYLGVLISKEDYISNMTGNYRWLVLIIGVALYASGFFTHGFFKTIGGIVISISLALLLDQCLPKTFRSFRNYTYQIFLMGIFAQMFVKILFRHVNIPYLLGYLLCLLIGLYAPVIISKLLEKLNWMPLLLCVGLKKK